MPMLMKTTRPKLLARHALNCSSCRWKATRLMSTPTHLERQELLCAIEYCELKKSGRKLHA